VKNNIAQFGGDPSWVAIFGESAGGIAAGMLSAAPGAKGLFQRAISESGGAFAPPRVAAVACIYGEGTEGDVL
jgi:para-nitrobenzyl esterase